jgi:hypothetical protein
MNRFVVNSYLCCLHHSALKKGTVDQFVSESFHILYSAYSLLHYALTYDVLLSNNTFTSLTH